MFFILGFSNHIVFFLKTIIMYISGFFFIPEIDTTEQQEIHLSSQIHFEVTNNEENMQLQQLTCDSSSNQNQQVRGELLNLVP